MIPLKLVLNGFLSYRDPVTLDFTQFDLACISGSNGAGKSSLLDAMTWALFGQARKRDESIIHMHQEVKAAEVSFMFAYEGNIYRVQRTLPRGKSTVLEFHIYQGQADDPTSAEATRSDWRPLTESSGRETQARIERTLRLDYDTFINASFFLQGKADQFTQHRPGERKRILSSILGLEIWETYREIAAERRKVLESQIATLQGSLREISAELSEEENRKGRLAQLEGDLEHLAQARQAQAAALETMRQIAATLAEQNRLVAVLERQAETARVRLADLENRLASRQVELAACQDLLARSTEIQAAYATWQQARQELTRWEEVAGRFRNQEQRRQAPLEIIGAECARLEAERSHLLELQAASEADQASAVMLHQQLAALEQVIAQVQSQLGQKAQAELALNQARQRLADARVENPRLKQEMDDLKIRIDRLQELESPNCPFCGQPLDAVQKSQLIADLTAQGGEMGDRWRENKRLLDQADQLVNGLEAQMAGFGQLENELRDHLRSVDQLHDRLQQNEARQATWVQSGLLRLEEVEDMLRSESFAGQARAQLAVIDAELRAIGYDAATHDQVRRQELEGRHAESELRELEKANATHFALQGEMDNLHLLQVQAESELAQQRDEHAAAAAALAQAKAQAPDIQTAERELFAIQEQENRLRLEVGAARQKVLVLDDLKARRRGLEAEQQELARQVARYKQLERAFGKDGVPALLIEQALPQIEEKANEILDRLSGGSMTVRFLTQAAYKDKRRDDMKETLDIQISDSSGMRDYEMYSGGEAFRVNFAIRLALSEVLAQRAGARLQMLVIDEGFGSQDTQGRQRLIEAINLVRPDFAKVLVITHIDELKDAFPSRIEVEKTARGSMLRLQ